MNNLRLKFLLILFTAAFFQSVKGQSKLILADGVYESVKDVILATPTLLRGNIYGSSSASFNYKNWFERDSIFTIDDLKHRTVLNKDSIYIIVDKGTPFVCLNKRLHKIQDFGKLSYFIESYPVVKAPFSPVATEQTRESSPRFLILNSKKIINYTASSLLDYLSKEDEDLFKEYSSIKQSKQRRNALYSFFEKYNSRHPLQPENL
jgi:hypothetical protein